MAWIHSALSTVIVHRFWWLLWFSPQLPDCLHLRLSGAGGEWVGEIRGLCQRILIIIWPSQIVFLSLSLNRQLCWCYIGLLWWGTIKCAYRPKKIVSDPSLSELTICPISHASVGQESCKKTALPKNVICEKRLLPTLGHEESSAICGKTTAHHKQISIQYVST